MEWRRIGGSTDEAGALLLVGAPPAEVVEVARAAADGPEGGLF